MSYTTPATVTNNVTQLDEDLWNTSVRDNILETAPAKVTTKGDIVAATGANAIVRVGIGADDTILVADSAATAGVAWKGLEKQSTQFPATGITSPLSPEDQWVDVSGVSTTIETTFQCTLVAIFACSLLITGGDGAGISRLDIDGVAQHEVGALDGTAPNQPKEDSHVPLTLLGYKSGVTAGTHTVKLQHWEQASKGTTVTYNGISLIVFPVPEFA